MGEHVCEINDIGVHSCRPLLGARAAQYPTVRDDFVEQHLWHGRRVGRRIDLAHAFAAAGTLPLADRRVAQWVSDGGGLIHNWKPSRLWTDAAGASRAVDTLIDKAAVKIARMAPAKVHLVVHHEPENDVGIAGSASDYRAMWRHVRKRFDAVGVDNVIWGMAYMNYPRWNRRVPELYPGDDVVDWVWFNAYGSAKRRDLENNVAGFLELLDDEDIGVGKPRGIIEWSITGVPLKQAVGYFQQATAIMKQSVFDEQIKAWCVFDSPGTHNQGGLRLGFDDNGMATADKITAYRKFAAEFSCPQR